MITLAILDKLLTLFHNVLYSLSPVATWFDNLGDKIHALQYPQDLIQIFGIAKVFLPSQTITTLFVITAILVGIAILGGLIKFILHLGVA